MRQRKGRRRLWRWAALGAVVLLAVGASWLLSEAQRASRGTPRLVVDRTEIDLGDFPFEKWARAVFTLTNAGDGLLKVTEVLSVTALKGC